MAEEYTTAALAQSATVTEPEDGDPLTAASARAASEEHSDAIELLQQIVNPSESVAGALTFTRSSGLPPILHFGTLAYKLDDDLGTLCPVVRDSGAATTAGARSLHAWPFEPPHGSVIKTVTVTVDPDTNIGLPDGELNKIQVYEVDIATATRTLIGTQIDPTAVEATYEAIHSWTCTLDGGGRLADRGACTYYVLVSGEWGTNCSGGGTQYYGCRYTYEVATIDPAAG